MGIGRRAFADASAIALLVSAACAPGAAAPGAEAPVAAVAPAGLESRPAYCVDALQDDLQDITDAPASPYLIHHPAPDVAQAPIVIFLPGGSGSRASARRLWESFLAGAGAAGAFRIVIPYSAGELLDEYHRTLGILDEVLACYGGDPRDVHLAGSSNGGLAAFALMLERPERFATLLGAPGEFPRLTPGRWADPLRGKAVFNGVGDLDRDWKSGVMATHEGLVSVGIDSVYVEFPGQAHGAGPGFDKDVLFAFWTRHSRLLGGY